VNLRQSGEDGFRAAAPTIERYWEVLPVENHIVAGSCNNTEIGLELSSRGRWAMAKQISCGQVLRLNGGQRAPICAVSPLLTVAGRLLLRIRLLHLSLFDEFGIIRLLT